MKKFIISLLLFGCSGSIAEIPFSFSAEQLFSSSDVVAIVELSEGKLTNEGLYLLKASLEKSIKGKKRNSFLSFAHREGHFSDKPDRLGGKYLVFLKTHNGIYTTNTEGFSVIEVAEIAAERPDMELALRRLNLGSNRIVNDFDKETVWYPVICTYGSEKICENAFDILEYALRK
ncbi:hypothetical protein Misp06_00268 [Microbulbifer sp. NBRC 101763]|uniref:hypothetical protein n=1 Tax=Microbulbifer sp. NBRC 101763 TaxID=1113820 RepID=UPI0030B41BE0